MSDVIETDLDLIDPVIKANWVEALRSGKYKQTKGVLEHRGKYCCLGVLMVIQGADINKHYPTYEHKTRSSVPFCYDPGLGIDISNKLAEMNDTGKSFKEIADWIESNL